VPSSLLPQKKIKKTSLFAIVSKKVLLAKIVQMINYLLLFFNADIKASCNCVKTTVIQQRTIDSIQAWAELFMLSVRGMVAGTY